MDQDKFCDLGNFDESEKAEIDLTQPPTSGEAYLRQVIVGRERCQPIVVANRDFTSYTAKRTSQIPADLLPEIAPDQSNSPPFPPKSWRQQQRNKFDDLRWELTQKRNKILEKVTSKIRFPNLGNEEGWKKFCFETCTPQITDQCSKNSDLLKLHSGTPPLLTIIASLSPAQATDLFEFQVAWFVEEGYRADRMHWLYALMLLIEKPLTPEACSALRDMARALTKIRQAISADDKSEETEAILKACNLFLCLVVEYFGQRDLAIW